MLLPKNTTAQRGNVIVCFTCECKLFFSWEFTKFFLKSTIIIV